MLNLLSSIAVQDEVTTNVVTLSNIMEGVDGSATLGLETTETSVMVDDGQTRQVYHDHSLDIRVLRTNANVTFLDGIISNGRKALISGYSPNGFVLFNTPNRIVRNEQFDVILANAFKATVRTPIGYRRDSTTTFLRKAMHVGSNALAMYAVNNDVSPTAQPNGFALSSGVSSNFGGGVFAFERETGGDSTPLFVPIFFPFPGVRITASANVTAQTGNGVIGFKFLEKDMTTVVSTSTAVISSGTGIRSHSVIIPDNTAYFQYLLAPDDALNDTISFNNIMVGMGTNTKFSL